MGFAGEADAISFVFATSNIQNEGYDLEGVGYRLGDGCLIREERLIPYSSLTSESQETIWEGIKELRFSYFDGESWLDFWDKEQGLPLAVEVRVYPEKERPFYLLVDILGGAGIEEG